MITLLASLAGFLSSLIPDIMKYFIDKNDKKHEIQILEYQMQIQKINAGKHLEEIISANNISDTQAIYKTYKTGISWVDAFNGTVRPVLAYAFFSIYAFIKFLQYKVISTAINMGNIVEILCALLSNGFLPNFISSLHKVHFALLLILGFLIQSEHNRSGTPHVGHLFFPLYLFHGFEQLAHCPMTATASVVFATPSTAGSVDAAKVVVVTLLLLLLLLVVVLVEEVVVVVDNGEVRSSSLFDLSLFESLLLAPCLNLYNYVASYFNNIYR